MSNSCKNGTCLENRKAPFACYVLITFVRQNFVSFLLKQFFILISILIFYSPLFAEDPPELRAFYGAVWDINSQAECDAVIANALARNVNAVFVEVRARADAYYFPNREDSTYPNNEPRGELYSISPANLDVLQYFIDRLHNANPRREVHAWCTTYPTWNSSTPPSSPNHIYNAHPEWITENKAGSTLTYTDNAPLDPGIPAVQDHLYNVFMDIVRNYDIDGIHFDYVRLLSSDSGYDPVAKAEFLAQTGWNYDTDNPGGQLDEVYEAWRRDQIAKLVQRVYKQTMLEKPWVEVSAFIVNFTDSIENLGQGYNWWVAHGAMDVLHLSCYSDSVSGAESDWNFSVSKLAENVNQYTRPLVSAIGDYLLTDPNENAQAVNTLRANSRKPDGFNFFDFGSLFLEGPGGNPDEHADNLFSPGGPMDDWAPVPSIGHKSGEETTPPNPPASLSVVLVGGIPRISFNRPATASDGDLPVHYRLYRDTMSPVKLYYANMIMEWWDPGSPRTSFSFDDVMAGSGTYYYAAAAYDDWNNQAVATAGPVSPTGLEIIIDDGDSGFSTSGPWSSSSGGDSYNGDYLYASSGGTPSSARWTPNILSSGNYEVFVWYRAGSNRANNAPYTVYYNGGNVTIRVNQQINGGQWNSLGTFSFAIGTSGYVQLSDDANPSVVIADAVRFLPSGLSPTPKEPKPPVSAPASSVTEVIVDSNPPSLDYDDYGGSGGWATTTWGSNYNGNARYYAAANFPFKYYAVWVVDLPRAGKWAIDGYIRSEQSGLAQGVQYRFVDGNSIVRNVTTTQRTGSGGWTINVDGVSDASAYDFNKGRVYVTLYGNTTGAEMIIADALRFRFLSPPAAVSDWMLF